MMSNGRTIVVGAGGFGKEVICWVRAAAEAGTLSPLGGFVDDQVTEMAGYDVDYLGTIDGFELREGDDLTIALGPPKTKRLVAERLKARGAKFANVIHPTCVVAPTATFGTGVIMTPFALAMPEAVIGDFVTLLNCAGVGHDSAVGEYTTMNSYTEVTGNCRIGNGVMMGAGSRVLPGLKVGDGATIGAGAVIMRSVPAGATMYAPPARRLNMPASEN